MATYTVAITENLPTFRDQITRTSTYYTGAFRKSSIGVYRAVARALNLGTVPRNR